jgi:Domain of unknown function (DUF4465)/Secretion system C-terminal sorting domain
MKVSATAGYFFLYLIFPSRFIIIVFKINFYMRRFTILFSALVLGATAMEAQTVATFESLSLSTPDTFYVNYAMSGTDVGFNNGLAHFPCVYDTSWGGFWSYGFAYSNMTDSVTSSYTNQYSAMAGSGFGGSAKYVVSYGVSNKVILQGAAVGHPVSGCYVTNSTYAHNSIRDGDPFARKFHNGDWFKLSVQGYHGGALQPAIVSMYLADFLFPDTTMNYIVRDWQWLGLGALGSVDSLEFTLSSTDNSTYGMNTPAYFCMDNFTTAESGTLTAGNIPVGSVAKVYPDPALNTLYVDVEDKTLQQVTLMDVTGNTISSYNAGLSHLEINTSTLPAGMYMLVMSGNGRTASAKFVKR